MATLTPSALTGDGVIFTADSAIFVTGDIGRIIISGASRATIVALGPSAGDSSSPNAIVRANITVAFTTTSAIAVDQWSLSVRLTPGATTGTGVIFTADAAVFLEADVGRYIISGAARALIKGFGPSAGDSTSPNKYVRADILDAFPNTDPIAGGKWFLRLSPQAALDVDKKGAVGAEVNLSLSKPGWRGADKGKFIKIYGGLIQITAVSNASTATGIILSILSDSTKDDPDAAPAGSWSLEVAAWSDTRGWPQALEFHQGRLWFGGTKAQPTTIWGSQSNSFENFAVGSLADSAVQYTIANRSVDAIQWLQSAILLFIADATNEHDAKGRGVDTPIGGDEVPFVVGEGDQGANHSMAHSIQRAVLFVQTFARKVIEMTYDIGNYGYIEKSLNLYSRHLTQSSAFRQHPIIHAQEPNNILFFPRLDGQVCCLTYNRLEQVAGWSRVKTAGTIESITTIPDGIHGHDDIVYLVSRTIGGDIKRFVEIVIQPSDTSTALTARPWRAYHTDCGIDGTLAANTHIIPGLSHLEGRTVDVVLGTSFIGQYPVTGGQVDIGASNEAETERVYEVGLHYDSILKTMRPSIPNQVVEGLRRWWKNITVRLLMTVGGTVNGEDILYPPQTLDSQVARSGSFVIPVTGEQDFDGYITVEQKQPYPMSVLSISGTCVFADYEG